MSKVRSRGTTVHMGTKAANPLTDTYVKIEGTVTIAGNIGIKFPEGDTTTLEDDFKQTGKVGPADLGRCTITGQLDEAVDTGLPPGLAALKAAAEDDSLDANYNVKVVRSNGRVKYLRAGIFEFTETVNNNQSLIGFNSVAILSQLSADAAPSASGTPVNTRLPAIAGIATVGETLTAIPGEYTDAVSVTRRWQRDDSGWVDIVGATGLTYVPKEDDVGDQLRIAETATGITGSITVYSGPTVAVEGDD